MDHRDALTEAARLLGERGETYGGVEESFTRAAKIASLKLNREVSAYDIAIIMESVKDARRAITPTHLDSHLDGINYRAFACEFAMAQEPTPKVTTITDPVFRDPPVAFGLPGTRTRSTEEIAKQAVADALS